MSRSPVRPSSPGPSPSTGPATRADLRWWLLADLAADGIPAWRVRFRLTRPDLARRRRVIRAAYWRHATDRPRLLRTVMSAVLAHRAGDDVPVLVGPARLAATRHTTPRAS